MALVRSSPMVPKEMCRSVPCHGVEDCKQRVKDLLFSSMLEGCVEEFQAAASDHSRLLCPISGCRHAFGITCASCWQELIGSHPIVTQKFCHVVPSAIGEQDHTSLVAAQWPHLA